MKRSAKIDLKTLFLAGIVFLAFAHAYHGSAAQLPIAKPEVDFLRTGSETGIPGGRLVVSLTAEPKTLNPLTVFLALIFWTWLWGPVGAFLAVPLLIVALVAINHLFPQEERVLPG